jgi:hypothetical protein
MRLLLASLLVPSLAGCGEDGEGETATRTISSQSVAPADVDATFVVTSNASGGTDVRAFLEDRAGRTLILVGGDAVKVAHDGAATLLEPDVFAPTGYLSYRASIPRTSTVAISLELGGAAFRSSVALPAAFALDVEAPRTFSRANDDVVLRWSPVEVGERMYWYALGECISLRGESDVADEGRLVIPRGSWSAGSESCDVTIHVRRSWRGAATPALAAAAILGEELRTVRIATRP